jgi:hypothetical protein
VHGAPQPDTKYVAFVDAASGTGKDSYALAIAHVEPDGSVVIDVVRERKPRFVPSQVIAEYAELLAAYHVTEIFALLCSILLGIGRPPSRLDRAIGFAYCTPC